MPHDPAKHARVAKWLEHAKAEAKTKELRETLCLCEELIESFRQEIITMARDFVSAVDVVLADDAKLKTDNAALTAANTDLTAKVADLTSKQATPETLAAQQKIVDASEVISPSAPVAPPAQ